MKHLLDTPYLRRFTADLYTRPHRGKSAPTPVIPNEAFVKSVRQNFVKDQNILPMTRIMILNLLGWSGRGQALETTRGIIGKHIGRSARQVSRYLADAVKAGYITYAYTKDRIGYITGLKIYLNFALIRPTPLHKKAKKTGHSRALPSMADTNTNYNYKRKNTQPEQAFLDVLQEISKRNHLDPV